MAASRPLVARRRRNRRHQTPCVWVEGLSEQVNGPTDLDDSSGIHHRDPVADLPHQREVVADVEHGCAQPMLKFRDQIEDPRLDGDIESGSGLVGDEEVRVAGERLGDQHSLLHPTRKLMRVAGHDPARVRDLCLGQGPGYQIVHLRPHPRRLRPQRGELEHDPLELTGLLPGGTADDHRRRWARVGRGGHCSDAGRTPRPADPRSKARGSRLCSGPGRSSRCGCHGSRASRHPRW